jgi:hypothetical protein
MHFIHTCIHTYIHIIRQATLTEQSKSYMHFTIPASATSDDQKMAHFFRDLEVGFHDLVLNVASQLVPARTSVCQGTVMHECVYACKCACMCAKLTCTQTRIHMCECVCRHRHACVSVHKNWACVLLRMFTNTHISYDRKRVQASG